MKQKYYWTVSIENLNEEELPWDDMTEDKLIEAIDNFYDPDYEEEEEPDWELYLLSLLPKERDREIIQLRHRDWTFTQIGIKYGITRQVAHEAYHRAIKKLKRIIKKMNID